MMPHRLKLGAPCFLAVSMTVGAAEQSARTAGPWQWTLQAGGVYQFNAGLDAGGEMSAVRFFVSSGTTRRIAERWRVGADLGYGEDHYHFSGSSGFGALDPWGRVHELRVSVPVQYFANQRWSGFAIPSLRFNAESGASLSDGTNAGLLAGAAYRFSDTLSIGPGFGAFTEIEDTASFFPLLLIDWQITETLSLETGGGFAASRGPGLQLRWRATPRWQFALGGRYEKTRFRLDDQGPAPGGVGQDKAFPLVALAEFTMQRNAKLSLLAGTELGASVRLFDASGGLVSDSDLATAPFLGMVFMLKL